MKILKRLIAIPIVSLAIIPMLYVSKDKETEDNNYILINSEYNISYVRADSEDIVNEEIVSSLGLNMLHIL